MTNYEFAVSLLKAAKNVTDWNEIRAEAKKHLPIEDINKIDSSGLIVQVLGPDYHVPTVSHVY